MRPRYTAPTDRCGRAATVQAARAASPGTTAEHAWNGREIFPALPWKTTTSSGLAAALVASR
jgi:hypothetical protein